MLIAIAVVCTLLEAIFTALEVAMSTVSRARLRAIIEAAAAHQAQAAQQTRAVQTRAVQSDVAAAPTHASTLDADDALAAVSRDSRRAACALRLLEQPERLTALFITVTSLSLWTAASALAWQSLSDDWPAWALPLALLGVLFVAEVLPLLLAARRGESVALGGASLAQASLKLLSPLLWLLSRLGYAVARLLGAGPMLTTQVTEGELRTALATAEQEGVIESDERAMLEGVMNLRETPVREVMTPRSDVVAVPRAATLDQVLETAVREGHSRLPVYDGTLDTILGIISTKDLIPHLRHVSGPTPPADASHPEAETRNPITARDVMRPAFFVSDDKRIEPALEELRRQRSLMAIVRDAGGATVGLVTLEDLLEEIVGEIQDEYDEAEPSLRVVSAGPKFSESGGPAGMGQDRTEAPPVLGGGPAAHHAVICDAGVSVRDFERFWKRSFDEAVRLRTANGASAMTSSDGTSAGDGSGANAEKSVNAEKSANGEDASLSLADLALRLFNHTPHVGDRVVAGRTASASAASASAAGASVTDAASPGEPVIQMEITAMDGPRVTEVKLEKVPRDEGATMRAGR